MQLLRAPEARARILGAFYLQTAHDVIIFKFQGVQLHPLAPPAGANGGCVGMAVVGYMQNVDVDDL